MRLDDLPDAVLGAILALAGGNEGPAVTLVSQRWRRVFYSEPTLWQWLAVTAAPFPAHPRDTDGEALWLANKQALLDRVAPLVHTAVLRDGGNSNPLQLGSLIRHLQQAPLTQLTIELYRLTEEAVVAMGSLQQLTSLALTSQMLPPVPARLTTATRLAQLPARLPHLRSLTIEAAELPEAAVDSLLALPHLTYLRLHTIVGPLPPMQRLTALAALQHLSLLDESFDGTMTAVPVPEPACFPAIGVYSVCLEEGAEVAGVVLGSLLLNLNGPGLAPVPSSYGPSLNVSCDFGRPDVLPRLLANALPLGVQLASLELSDCRLDAAVLHACAPALSVLQSMRLRLCASPDMGASFDALLEACGQQLSQLVFVAEKPENAGGVEQAVRPLAFPPRLAGCESLRHLEVVCGTGVDWEWPAGPYMAGLELLDTDTLSRVLPALTASTSLTTVTFSSSTFRLTDAGVEVLSGLPHLKHLSIPCVDREDAPALQRLRAAAGPRLMLSLEGRALGQAPDMLAEWSAAVGL